MSPVTDPRGNRPERVGPLDWHIADMRGYFSCGRAFNHCMLQAFQHREIACIVSDKCVPTIEAIERGVELIDSGNMLVGLYRLAFFLMHRDISERVGWFNENFLYGVGEEGEYLDRCKLAGVKYIYEESVPYLPGPSKWKHCPSRKSASVPIPQYPIQRPDTTWRIHPPHGVHE